MNTKNRNTIIKSVILALVPLGPLALLNPDGEVLAGVMIIAALAILGVMEVRHSVIRSMPKPAQRKRSEQSGLLHWAVALSSLDPVHGLKVSSQTFIERK